jgi:hypothetical protein
VIVMAMGSPTSLLPLTRHSRRSEFTERAAPDGSSLKLGGVATGCPAALDVLGGLTSIALLIHRRINEHLPKQLRIAGAFGVPRIKGRQSCQA